MTVIMLHAAANAKVAATRHGQQLRIARRRWLLLLLQLWLQCIRIQLKQHSVRRLSILLATLAWLNDAWQASVCHSCCCCILLSRGASAPTAAAAAVAVIVAFAAQHLLLLLGTECSGRRVLIAQHTRLVHQLKVVQPKRLITGRMSWPGLGRRLQMLLLLLEMMLMLLMMMMLLLLLLHIML